MLVVRLRAFCISAALLIPLVSGVPATADEPECYVCQVSNLSNRLECADADTFFQLGRRTCEITCTTSGEFELCTCRTTGADCGYQDIPDDPFSAGLEVRLAPELLAAVEESHGKLVRSLLALPFRGGETEGIVSVRRPKGGELETYAYRSLHVADDKGGSVLVVELEGHPELTRLAVDLWDDGREGFLTLETPWGDRRGSLLSKP